MALIDYRADAHALHALLLLQVDPLRPRQEPPLRQGLPVGGVQRLPRLLGRRSSGHDALRSWTAAARSPTRSSTSPSAASSAATATWPARCAATTWSRWLRCTSSGHISSHRTRRQTRYRALIERMRAAATRGRGQNARPSARPGPRASVSRTRRAEKVDVMFFAGCTYSLDESLRDAVRDAGGVLQAGRRLASASCPTAGCCGGLAYHMGYRDEFAAAGEQDARSLGGRRRHDRRHPLRRLLPHLQAALSDPRALRGSRRPGGPAHRRAASTGSSRTGASSSRGRSP